MARMTLKMPKLAVSMQEGTIVDWRVASGDSVAIGQILYEVESEKSTAEIESPFAGTIEVLVEPGVTLPVGTPIARIET